MLFFSLSPSPSDCFSFVSVVKVRNKDCSFAVEFRILQVFFVFLRHSANLAQSPNFEIMENDGASRKRKIDDEYWTTRWKLEKEMKARLQSDLEQEGVDISNDRFLDIMYKRIDAEKGKFEQLLRKKGVVCKICSAAFCKCDKKHKGDYDGDYYFPD